LSHPLVFLRNNGQADPRASALTLIALRAIARASAFALIALRNNGQADPRPDAKTFATLGAGGPLRTIAGAIALVAL
jgi:hypothetical protein